MGSIEWYQTFDKASCQHIDTYASDHSMLSLNTCTEVGKKKRRFYFDKRWLQREEVYKVVERAWQKEEVGSRMFKITKKIRNCRIELLKWRNTFKANSKSRIEEIKKELERVKNSDCENRKGVVAELKNQLKEAYTEEENFWSQKARIN